MARRATGLGAWRAATLAAVQLLIIVHLLHWWYAGQSLDRLVLDDAAVTLQQGLIRPGFLLFALVLLVTLVGGRLFCGWACHMAALQDLCAWLLRRAGIQPRPFRARLIAYAPMVLAVYLFVWPLLKRDLLIPLIGPIWPQWAAWLGPVPAFSGWRLSLTGQDLWSGLPSAAVAVPFLLLSGFAMVYFLGARGLCRYGCPYGGVFQPAAQWAPIVVEVNPEACDGCARCTAACTIGVRVHEQIRTHGAVVDRDCMRTLDCIEACPTQALRLRPGRPAALRRADQAAAPGEQRFDLGADEEGLVALAMLLTVFATRGLYGQIPLLLAVTLGALAGFFSFLTLRLVRSRQMRFGGRLLKSGGHLTGWGKSWTVLSVLAIAVLLHSLAVQGLRWQAERLDRQITVPLAVVLEQDMAGVPNAVHATASRALHWYQWADSWRHGGLGLGRFPEIPLRRAWLHLVLGQRDRARELLEQALVEQPKDATLQAALSELRGPSPDGAKLNPRLRNGR